MKDVGRIRPHIGASTDPPDRAIAALAERQQGVVAYWQLIDLGFGRRAIQYRVHAGRLHRVYVGVYAVGHRVLTPAGWAMAAVLACGPNGVLSHRSAAARLGLLQTARTRADVTVPSRSGRAQRRIEIHRVRALDTRDWFVLDGIPMTSVPRTLLDLAEVVPNHRLKRAVEEAIRQERFDLRAVEDLCVRSRGRRGIKPLRAVLSEGAIEPGTRSEFEARVLELIVAAELPRPQLNVLVAGFEVDMYWPDRRLIVELDGYAYHSTRAAFERDRRRDVQLQLAGYQVLRFTWRQLIREPHIVVAALRAALRAR